MRHHRNIIIIVFVILLGILIHPPRGNACDTWVALTDAVKNGVVILAKNSDRPLFDSQPLLLHTRVKWPSEASINLGRLTIPQVPETYAVLGSSPYWCWGYEEGINEFGVAIGNEGVNTKPLQEALMAYKKDQSVDLGLTGMDLVRLGLERGKTAREALDVITGLLEEYGQFGAGIPGAGIDGAYDNSFLIADPREAWILETAGRHWAAKHITKGIASISNKLSIKNDWDLISNGITQYASEHGWLDNHQTGKFPFEETFKVTSAQGNIQDQRAAIRAARSYGLRQDQKGKISADWMKRIARDRTTDPGIDLDQTASSCVAVLPSNSNDLPVFWWCAGTPSVSCYIPCFVHSTRLPVILSKAGTQGRSIISPMSSPRDSFTADSFWWLFRDLNNLVKLNYDRRQPRVRKEFDRLEKDFSRLLPDTLQQARTLRKKGLIREAAVCLDNFTSECTERVVKKVNELRLTLKADTADIPDKFKAYVGRYNGNFGPYRDEPFTVSVLNQKLALDIPGQRLVTLREPDEQGLHRFVLNEKIAVSFVTHPSGPVAALRIHQPGGMIFELPRLGTDFPPAIPMKSLQKYLGFYHGEKLKETLEIVIKNRALALKIPGQKTYELRPPDQNGHWKFRVLDRISIVFEEKESGEVSAFRYYEGKQILKYIRKQEL